eukprot:COSAG05_NODE_372_length_10695_cov_5.301623_6_plen_129_part_00
MVLAAGTEVKCKGRRDGYVLFKRHKGVKVLEIEARSVELHPDVVAGEEAIRRFNLAENDIFVTPPEAHEIASRAVGWDTAAAFDPCAASADIGRDDQGQLIDGLCSALQIGHSAIRHSVAAANGFPSA